MRDKTRRKTLARLDMEEQVLKVLEEPHSIAAISDRLGFNYYTIRDIISDLHSQGKIKIVNTVDRHRIYALAVGNNPNDTIPYINNILSRTQHKAIGLMEAVGREDSMSTLTAIKELPELVTKLMHYANVASHNLPVGSQLDGVRDQMQRNYLMVKNVANVYEEILNEPRFWTEKYLKTFVDDPDYVYTEVQKAWEYYDRAE